MQFSFIGHDFGILVLGRAILKKLPQVKIKFFLGKDEVSSEKKLIQESDLWKKAFYEILKQTRFGKIGIFYDRKNFEAASFFQKQIKEIDLSKYHPKESKRALKKPQINLFETQILREFANEGLSDSVEFRRLTRKYIRHAKNAGCDLIFFPEAIFGEIKTKKILQHLTGKQRKVFTIDDFLIINSEKTTKLEIKIHQSKENSTFVKQRAEKILQTKLSDSVFE